MRWPLQMPVFGLALLLAWPPVAGAEEEGLVTRSHDLSVFALDRPPVGPTILGLPLLALDLESDWEWNSAAPELPADAIAGLVREAVRPAYWADVEGAVAEVDGHTLRIHAEAAVHEEVVALLHGLWAVLGRRVEVTAEAVRLPADLWRAEWGAEGRIPAAVAAGLLEAARARGARPTTLSTLLRPGRWGTLEEVDRSSYVGGYEVEIAQDSAVADPVVEILSTGWSFAVRPFALQDGTVFLEAFVQSAAADLPHRRLPLEAEPFGTVDLPAVDGVGFTTAARLRPDEVQVTAIREPGRGGEVTLFLLSARVRGGAPSVGAIRPLDLSFLASTRFAAELLFDRVHGVLAGASFVPAFQALEGPEPTAAGEWLARLGFEPTAGEDTGERWTVAAERVAIARDSPERLAAMAGRLAAWEAAAAATVRVSVRLAGAGVGGDLAAAWMELPPGRAVGWRAATERAYLMDWDVEVAQEARIGDPLVGRLFDGLAMNLRADPAPGGGAVLLAVDLVRTAAAPFSLLRHRSERTGVIEIARVTRSVASRDLVLARGETVALPVGTTPEGAPLVLEIRAGL